nr:CPBP family intramembrane metalloprotease [Actinomycetales bacterium]
MPERHAAAERRAWWRLSAEYEAQLPRFGRTDALLALAVAALFTLLVVLSGLWYNSRAEFPSIEARTRLGLAQLTVLLVVLGVLAALRKQDARTFGFSRTHLGRSLLVGAVLAALFLGAARAIAVADGTAPELTGGILPNLVTYYLAIGFTEELVWRGWVTPRLEGAFRRRWVGVVVAGALFGLMHLPFTYLMDPLPLGKFLATYWWRAAIPFGWHFVFWYLYGRFSSLAAPTLFHLALNLAGDMM